MILLLVMYTECMTNENLHLSGKELYDPRKRAVRMKRNGHTHAAVAEAFGVGDSTVRKWWALFKKIGGFKALYPPKRGRKEGQHRCLTTEQEHETRRLITQKSPDQLKLGFALWTRRAVVELIREHFGMTISIHSVGRYLKRWGFTPQKPLK